MPAVSVQNQLSQVFFYATSPYDPEYVSGGNSAVGFSTYSAMYQRYLCYGSKIRVTLFSQNAATQIAYLVPCINTGDIGVAMDPERVIAMPYCRWRVLLPSGQGAGGRATLKGYMTSKKMHGRRSSDDNFTAATNAVPYDNFFWAVMTQNTANVLPACNINVELVYYTKFYDRRILT